MRLPHSLQESQFFIFSDMEELLEAAFGSISDEEIGEITRLTDLGLPPITSQDILGLMLGINPGIIWSFERQNRRHYRPFEIDRGRNKPRRLVLAPRVGIKVIQTWLSYHFERVYKRPLHCFGFVPGFSHLDAAHAHLGARWIFNVDIKDFFPTTPASHVVNSLVKMGYNPFSANMISRLCCYFGFLPQGAPTSPILSNLVFSEVDVRLAELQAQYDIRLSRYADDIVFSGTGDFPVDLPSAVDAVFLATPWKISEEKRSLTFLPNRLKVHGLLVHGEHLRLTKGYRRRIRAYRHLNANGKIIAEDQAKVMGHLMFARQVEDYKEKLMTSFSAIDIGWV
ncbi:MAG: reverse transcriptase family protein [Aestuariivirga sp.]